MIGIFQRKSQRKKTDIKNKNLTEFLMTIEKPSKPLVSIKEEDDDENELQKDMTFAKLKLTEEDNHKNAMCL